MKRNSKLSIALHALMHIAKHQQGRMTSEDLAACLSTNPVVIRRVLGAMRKFDLVSSEKGRGGGWMLNREPKEITLFDIYSSIDEKIFPQVKISPEDETCLIVRSISTTMHEFVEDANSLLESRLKRLSLKTFLTNIENSDPKV